jgi:hypothetical protein
MDDKYFDAKQTELLYAPSYADEIAILKRIAADAREEQARKIGGEIEKLAESCGCNEVPTADEILAALDRAKGE